MAHSSQLFLVLSLCSVSALEAEGTSSCSNVGSGNSTVQKASEVDASEVEALVQMKVTHQSKAKLTPECCQAHRPYNNQQVDSCGCNSKHFPAGTRFMLEGKWVTVETSWNVACTMKNCEGGCATVNFKPAQAHWWSQGSAIKFEGDTCPAGSRGPPSVTPQCCKAHRPYNNQQVDACGCNSEHFPAGTRLMLEGKWITVETSWNVACSMSNCQGGCATVNFYPAQTHWWSQGSPIKFQGDSCPAGSAGPPTISCTHTFTYLGKGRCVDATGQYGSDGSWAPCNPKCANVEACKEECDADDDCGSISFLRGFCYFFKNTREYVRADNHISGGHCYVKTKICDES